MAVSDCLQPPAAETRDPRSVPTMRILVLSGLLGLVTLLAYLRALGAPFIFDDLRCIVEDSQVRAWWPNSPVMSSSPRRLADHSLAFNYWLDGLRPRGYHLFNLLVHIAAGATLLGVARHALLRSSRLALTAAGATWTAFTIALLWSLHPLQTNSVTYTIQRYEATMGLFFLLSLYGLTRGSAAPRGGPWYLVAVVACWLGTYCKEVMVTAAPVLLLYDRIFLAGSWREVARRRWWVHLAFGAAAGVLLYGALPAIRPSAAAAATAATDASAGFGFRGVTAWEYLRSQPGIILHYLRLCFWPQPLCLDYAWPVAESWTEIVLPGLVILGLLAASLLALRYAPRLGFLGVAFFVILAPTSSFMPIADLAFEHRMYLPLAAVITLAVLGVREAIQAGLRAAKSRKLARLGAAVAATATLFFLTLARNRDYCDPLVLWTKNAALTPHNERVFLNLGRVYGERGEYALEREQYEKSLAANPGYARAIQNLAVCLAREGKIDEAIDRYEQAVRINPRYVKAYVNMGNLYGRKKDFVTAIACYEKALKISPRDALAYQSLGLAWQYQGKAEEALQAYREALRLRPELIDARLWLAWLLAVAPEARLRDGEAAVRLGEQLTQRLGVSDFRLLDVQAAAYAEVGRFAEAQKKATRSAALAEEAGEKEQAKGIRARLALYKQQQPYRLERAGTDQGSPERSPAPTDDARVTQLE